METNPGFYKQQDGILLYAPNTVMGPDYELHAEYKDNYNYPSPSGWVWFDSELGARNFFDIWPTEEIEPLPDQETGSQPQESEDDIRMGS